MASRHQGREYALQMLYQAEAGGIRQGGVGGGGGREGGQGTLAFCQRCFVKIWDSVAGEPDHLSFFLFPSAFSFPLSVKFPLSFSLRGLHDAKS